MRQRPSRNSVVTVCTVLAMAGMALRPARGGSRQNQERPGMAGKPLTVERIYGQPSLSGSLTRGLQWSPDGKLLGYLQRSGQGGDAREDIWVIEVATGERRMLLDSDKFQSLVPPASEPPAASSQQTGLGRITPESYFWSPGSDALLLVSQGNLYWFDLKPQTGKRLTAGKAAVQDPKISPDGRWVSFVRRHNLWAVNVATGREKQLTADGREEWMNGQLDWVYPEELGIRTATWWSPDSSHLAYLQMDERPVTRYPLVNYLSYTGETERMRYPKAGDANPVVRVGVVPVRRGKTQWMDTGRETDIYIARVAWLRDSKRLAIQRLNRAQTKLELLFADRSSGRALVVLTEENKYWVNLHDDLYLLRDGQRFLWSSERDGFRHLYLYDLGGKQIRQLTRGAWTVSGVAGVDEGQGLVYFTGSKKSPVERHLYRVGLDGDGFARVTQENGTHGISMAPDAGRFVDTYSNAVTPPRQDLMRADGSRQLVINDNKVTELADYRLSPAGFGTIPDGSGGKLYTMIIKPPDFDATRKYPVLIHTYGGPGSQVVREAWGGANFLWHQMMAQKGYIIFLADNGGEAGRGHASETPLHRKMGGAELAEQLAGVQYLKSLPYVDGSRIGIWGWSYGGYLTCMAMFKAADVFKAGFAGAPVTDWRQYDTIYTERYMGRPQENAEAYKQSAPVTHAGKLKGKLLIAHGTGDDNVHYVNTVQLTEQFVRAGKHAEVLVYPGRGHGIGDLAARVHLFGRVTQFFLDNL